MATSSTATELAKERSREAANRTLMAWIRTALSLIAFGFGIAKFYHYLKATGPFVGGSFILLGIADLSAGSCSINAWSSGSCATISSTSHLGRSPNWSPSPSC